MKKFLKSFVLAAMLLITTVALSQQFSYRVWVSNVTRVDTDSVTFQVFIQNLGTDSLKLCSAVLAFDWNYGGSMNKGTPTMGYVSGSKSSGLATPSITYNVRSLQLQITTPSVAVGSAQYVNSNGSTCLGRFYIRTSTTSTVGSKLNLLPFFGTATTTLKTTAIRCYLGTAGTIPEDITYPSHHYTLVNTALN